MLVIEAERTGRPLSSLMFAPDEFLHSHYPTFHPSDLGAVAAAYLLRPVDPTEYAPTQRGCNSNAPSSGPNVPSNPPASAAEQLGLVVVARSAVPADRVGQNPVSADPADPAAQSVIHSASPRKADRYGTPDAVGRNLWAEPALLLQLPTASGVP